jgi:hypothetical protein
MKGIGTRLFDDLGVPPENRKYAPLSYSLNEARNSHHPQDGLPHPPFQFDKPPASTPALVTHSWNTEIRVPRFEGKGGKVQGLQLVC